MWKDYLVVEVNGFYEKYRWINKEVSFKDGVLRVV